MERTTEIPTTEYTEYKAGFSLLAACLGRITLAEGFLWTVMALFGGQEQVALLQPGPVLAAGAAGFLLNHLLLRKDRSLLLMILLNLVLAAAGGWLAGARSAAAGICAGIGLALGLFSLLYWEIRQFRDEAMMIQFQILLVAAVWELWFSGQLDVRSEWIPVTFLMAGANLGGITVSKISGLSSAADTGRRGLPGKVGLAAAVVLLCGLICGGALLLAEPVGAAVSSGYGAAEGVLRTVLMGFAAAVAFLFRGKKIRVDGSMTEAGNGAGEAGMFDAADGGGLDFFLILFYCAIGAVLIMLLVTLIRALVQITVGAARRTGRKRSAWEAADGTLRERIWAFFQEVKQLIHARKLLRQNPSSVAALLVFLEAKCVRNRQLRRQPGETVRSFLCRLADYAEGKQPGMREILLGLADRADMACYGRDGNLLLPCEESEAIRSFFRENP